MPIASVLNILRTIKDRGAISRTDLQQVTGLSWGTITNTTRELLNRKLIKEEGALATKAGRKPVQLALNPSSHSLVGVDMGGDTLRCLVMNLAGEELWHEQAESGKEEGPEAVVQRVAEMVRRAMTSNSLVTRRSMGSGVAVPGILDATRSVVKGAWSGTGRQDVPVREMLESRLNGMGLAGQTVRLELHANCLTTAERWFGEASQVEDVLCIYLGMSVGMGVVIEGDIFRGSQGAAGALGLVTVDPQGPTSACGKRGCLDLYAAAGAVLEYARGRGVNAGSVEELATAAAGGNEAARATWVHVGRHVGLAVANLVEVLNPGLVVLAGPTTAGQAHFMPALEAEVAKVWREVSRKVVVSQLGERAAAMGACGVMLQAAFENHGVERATMTA